MSHRSQGAPIPPSHGGARILVIAPLGRDASLTVSVLEEAGYTAVALAGVDALEGAIEAGAGALLLAEEVLTVDAVLTLKSLLAAQPPWSDLPFLIFTEAPREPGAPPSRGLREIQPLANVTLVERPIRIAQLLSFVNTALRARRRQYQVRDLLQELREGVDQRDRFLAMLGHELRNPLNAMMVALQGMEVESDHPARPESIVHLKDIIARQGKVLSRLVDDLLEVSRVTSGKVALQPSRVDLVALARRACDTLLPRAAQQGLVLLCNSDVPVVWVDGDATRLEQVLSNLLTNAIKYTPPGGCIEVTLRRTEGQAVLSVRDNGVGIEPEMLPLVFDLFRQADRTLHRAMGGLGIGLTLVRSLVQLHGGSVSAESAGRFQGSEFIVRLPSAAAPETVRPFTETPAASSRSRRIFVLEDQEDNREALVLLLTQMGHRVISEGDGGRGLRRIVESRPEVALIDIGLPTLDGYEVAREVRAALGAQVTLIALTGYGQPDDQRRAHEAGFDAHLSKPLDIPSLRRLLEQPAPSTPVRSAV